MGYKFTDGKGREWEIKITVDTVRRCRRLDEPIDLNNIHKAEVGLLDRLTNDAVCVADVAYCAIYSKAQENGVTSTEFGESLSGDSLDKLSEIVINSIRDFTPNRRDRETLDLIIKKSGEAMDKARDLIEEHLTSGVLDQEIDRQMDLARDELKAATASSAVPKAKPKTKKSTSSKSPTASVGASVSTPADTPSAS